MEGWFHGASSRQVTITKMNGFTISQDCLIFVSANHHNSVGGSSIFLKWGHLSKYRLSGLLKFMKQAEGITSRAKTRKRVYELQAWAPFMTFLPALLVWPSCMDYFMVLYQWGTVCGWQRDPKMVVWTLKALFFHKIQRSGREAAWGCRQPPSHQKLGFLRLSVPLSELQASFSWSKMFAGALAITSNFQAAGWRKERREACSFLLKRFLGSFTQHLCSFLIGWNESEHDHT